jgi:hypothetical protein
VTAGEGFSGIEAIERRGGVDGRAEDSRPNTALRLTAYSLRLCQRPLHAAAARSLSYKTDVFCDNPQLLVGLEADNHPSLYLLESVYNARKRMHDAQPVTWDSVAMTQRVSDDI